MSAPTENVKPSLNHSCFVEASAGTGKTHELVHRIVDTLASGVPVDEVVAVTFTHAAAGEMKLRVREELDRRRPDPLVRANVAQALQTLDRAFIGTIHSFCAHLLRQRPVEARVDPSFTELSEQDASRVFTRVFSRWIERKLTHPSPAIHRALARLASGEDTGTDEPFARLRSAAWNLASWRDQPTAWEKRPFDRDTELLELITAAAHHNRMPLVREFVEWARRSNRTGSFDLDAAESELFSLVNHKKLRYIDVPDWMAFRDNVNQFRTKADAQLASALRSELWEAVDLYEAEKGRAGHLDFLDLLLCARDLLLNDEARRDLQTRYTRVFVDEFQDTDPLQAEIVLLLTADDPHERNWLQARPRPGKLFVVGDPKQSIYRFRRADAKLYTTIRDVLLGCGVSSYHLNASRRSTEPIQAFVNAAFSESLPEYLPLTGGEAGPLNQPSVIALPIPRPYQKVNVAKPAIEKCSPDAIAAFAHWLVRESGWTVREGHSGERVPVREDHICILFKRFAILGKDLTQHYVRSLEARGLKHVLVGSKSFHKREEICTLRAALLAVEWPDEPLYVYATLRGSLFAISDVTLLKFRLEYGPIRGFLRLPDEIDEEFEPVADALRVLRELHHERNTRPLADTINRLLEYSRAHAGFALRPGGERVLANVYRFTDVARNFETAAATSFRSFTEFLQEEYDSSSGTSETPILESESGGVKLMTVHKAKGLEFPVVILADLTCFFAKRDGGDRYVDPKLRLCAQRLLDCAPWELLDNQPEEAAADRDEAVRLAYVAATRARDLLVVSTLGIEEHDGWLQPLHAALYPPKEAWRFPEPSSGCPPFGTTTVLKFGSKGEIACIRPGTHRPRTGTHEVVWFDPALLESEAGGHQTVNIEALLSTRGSQATEGPLRYEAWKTRRNAIIQAGSIPEHQAVRAIDARATAELREIPVEVITARELGAREGGLRFGALVHQILQNARSTEECSRLAKVFGRALKPEQIQAAGKIVTALWSHPLLVESRAAARLYRELPLMVQLDDGRLIEGLADLAWTNGSSWTIVDYKTDSAEQERYRTQIRFYALALKRATGLPVRAVLLEL